MTNIVAWRESGYQFYLESGTCGPMAQDFHEAFGLSVSHKMIDTIDPNGVALAAIQGLEAKDTALAELRAEMEAGPE